MSEDRLDEIKAALKTIEAPWSRPIACDPPEDDASGKCDKTIFGLDSVSEGFEGGGYCVVANAWSKADADFIALAPGRLQWAIEEIERLRNPKPVWSIDYIAQAIRSGARLFLGLGRTEVKATHASYANGAVVLRDGPCPCPCHDPRAGIITHDTMCCAPIHYERQT
jgi:hypothetical protein